MFAAGDRRRAKPRHAALARAGARAAARRGDECAVSVSRRLCQRGLPGGVRRRAGNGQHSPATCCRGGCSALFPAAAAKRGLGRPAGLREGRAAARSRNSSSRTGSRAVFDRYLAYRPGAADRMAGRRGDALAGALWRELVRGHETTNPPALFRRLEEQFRRGHVPRERDLPERLVLRISSLPPFYLHLLNVVATSADVHLFLLEPTADTGPISSPRASVNAKRVAAGSRDVPEDEQPDRAATRCSLRSARSGAISPGCCLDRLDAANEVESFVAADRRHAAHPLQADIFELRERATRAAQSRPMTARSTVHCCHGPMREARGAARSTARALRAQRPT